MGGEEALGVAFLGSAEGRLPGGVRGHRTGCGGPRGAPPPPPPHPVSARSSQGSLSQMTVSESALPHGLPSPRPQPWGVGQNQEGKRRGDGTRKAEQ